MDWEGSSLSIGSPGLVLDSISWPYTVAIATLLISVLLTDVARVHEVHPGSWAAGLGLAGTGILAVTAANPLTLLLAWALIDLSETTTLMRAVTNSEQRERVVITFFAWVFGLLLVVAAILRATSLGMALSFNSIPTSVASYLVIAAGLRSGCATPSSPLLPGTPLLAVAWQPSSVWFQWLPAWYY